MLFWSLGIIFVFLVAQFAMGLGMGRIKEYIGDVCMRWLLAYGFFLIFYYSFCVLSGTTEADFDPSGHFACSLVAQANHASYYIFIAKKERHRGSIIEKVAYASFIFHQLHACYALFFAGMIFHTAIEGVVGWFFGLLIVGLTYETDLVTEALKTLLMLPFTKFNH